MSTATFSGLPRYDGPLLSEDALRDPFLHYQAIRDLGCLVWISELGIPAIARHADAQAALRTPDILVSSEGVGFSKFANHQTEERGVLTSDGDRHRRLRKVLAKPLMPAALKQHRPILKSMVGRRVAGLIDAGTFEAVDGLARFLPLNAVTVLVGLADEHREKMLDWADAFFSLMGPVRADGVAAARMARDLEYGLEIREFFATVDPAGFAPGSWSHDLFEAVTSGSLSLTEARGALRAFVIPSLDTTIYTKVSLLHCLATNPDQWQLLRTRPELISSAAFEAVRYSSVVRAFTRVAQADYRAGEVFVPAGERVMIIFGAANRDERRYASPDHFDVTRNPTDQLGWGTGPHMCAGMHLARMEIEVMLEALVEQVERIECDVPVMGTNPGLFGINELPMRFLGRS